MICQASPRPPRGRALGQVGVLCSGPAVSTLHFLGHLSQGFLGELYPPDPPCCCSTSGLSLGFILAHTRRPSETSGQSQVAKDQEITQPFQMISPKGSSCPANPTPPHSLSRGPWSWHPGSHCCPPPHRPWARLVLEARLLPYLERWSLQGQG